MPAISLSRLCLTAPLPRRRKRTDLRHIQSPPSAAGVSWENLETRRGGEIHHSEGSREDPLSSGSVSGLSYPFSQEEYLRIADHWLEILGNTTTDETIRTAALQGRSNGVRAVAGWRFSSPGLGRTLTVGKDKLPQKSSRSEVDAFLRKVAATPAAVKSGESGRLVFAMDATASRKPTWDHACHLQAQMF